MTIERNPCAAAFVIVGEKVGRADRFHFLPRARFGRAESKESTEGFVVHVFGQHDTCGGDFGALFGDLGGTDGEGDRVHDGRSHASTHRHRQEGIVNAVTVRKAKADVGRAASRVDPKLFAQATDKGENLKARCTHRANRHDQRVNHDVMCRDAKIGGAFDDFLSDCKAHVGVFRDACVIVRDRHNRYVIFFDQRQHHLKTFFLTGDRVQKWAAFRCGKPVFKCTGY